MRVAVPILAAIQMTALAAPPRYVATRELALDWLAAEGAPVTTAELWVSTDGGRSWQAAASANAGSVLRYAAAGDGRYDFYIVLRNSAGSSSPPPAPGTRPLISAIVDTTPPLLQIHGLAEPEPSAGEGAAVALRATLIEENLSERPLRVFYRSGELWQDGGPAVWDGSKLVWQPPPGAPAPIQLRVVASDLAGNQSAAEFNCPRPPANGPPPEEPSARAQPAPATVMPVVVPALARDPADVVLAGAAAPAANQPPATAPAVAPDTAHLRKLAARFINSGQYDLAAARLEEAASAGPPDAELLTELGGALYRGGRFEDARARFEEALAASPDHVGALEGLALVALTQKRYPLVREHLLHLQRLRPESGRLWLRSGDVEHRLGNLAAARAAWQRVLEVSEADEDLRGSARLRLDYFRAPGDPCPAAEAPCRQDAQPRPSSSSTGTKSTRNLRP